MMVQMEGGKGSVRVRPMIQADEAAWDRFVLEAPGGTFFHRAGWNTVLKRAFGHQGYYLMAERDGVISGILPLGRIKSLLFGDALISTPFCVYGGILAQEQESFKALEAEAQALARRLGVGHLEMRSPTKVHPQWLSKDLYVSFKKEIFPDPQRNLQEIPRKQRAEVRKGIKLGLEGAMDQDVAGICHDIYSESVHNLGTPVFSRRYFAVLKEVFAADCDALIIRHEGRPVAAVLNFYFKDQVLPYYGGGTAQARALGANPFMYWELMSRASMEHHARVFDFGRSKVGSGSYDFKRFFGFQPEPLHYAYDLIGTQELPNVSPVNPKYQRFIRLWRSLPLSVSRWVGPWISRNLG